jgi:TolB-like protein
LSLLVELKRRNVFRVVAAYGVTAWLIVQVADIALESFAAPPWILRATLISLAVGFPVVTLLAWVFELTSQGLKRDTGPPSENDLAHGVERPKQGSKLDAAIISILAIAVALLLLDRFVLDVGEKNQEIDRSVAVLPFVNMSGEVEQEYFSDGVTEEILNSLASVKEIKVAGRTSSFAFKGRNEDLRQVGETLGVAHILEGSVRKHQNKIRITAQLIKVEDGFHLWSETYERENENIFAIQDEIARAIQAQLKVELLGEKRISQTLPTTPEAYDLYLLAKEKMRQRSQASIVSAADLFDQVIAIDDTYAPAYAQKGLSFLLLTNAQYGDMELNSAIAQGKPLIDKALELDANLAMGWAAKGLMLSYQDSNETSTALEKALDLNPNLLEAKLWLGHELGSETPRAFELNKEINTVDPLFTPAASQLVTQYVMQGDYEGAKGVTERFFSFDPNNANMLAADASRLRSLGQLAEAFNMAERAYRLGKSAGTRFERQAIHITMLEFQKDGVFTWPVSFIAQDFSGRHEEALEAIAEENAPLFGQITILSRQHRYEQLLQLLRVRRSEIDAFPTGADQIQLDIILGEIGVASLRTADSAGLEFAIRHLEELSSKPTIQSVSPPKISLEIISGRHDAAVDLIEQLLELDFAFGFQLFFRPIFSLLEGNSRYDALESRFKDHINTERAKLGWSPIDHSAVCIRDQCFREAQVNSPASS